MYRKSLIALLLITCTACAITPEDRYLEAYREMANNSGKFVGDRRQLEQLLRTKQCRGCDLRGAKLNGQNLAGADLTGADFTQANLQGANLSGTRCYYLTGGFGGSVDNITTTFKGANLSQSDLSNALLFEGDFTDTNLNGANLSKAKLSGAKLSGAKLTQANLIEARFGSADLEGANLTSANLTKAEFGSAKLNRANFTQANLTQSDFGGYDLRGSNGNSNSSDHISHSGITLVVQKSSERVSGWGLW
jgi:uncharacterized protein YjbI with pentapeptide repeats